MTNRKITSAVSVIAGLIVCLGLSAWFLPPVSPVGEFQDITYNEIITDSTTSTVSNYDSTAYEDCAQPGENFDAGDRLYRLMVSDSATVTIEFDVLDTASLSLFLLSNVVDEETQIDCPDSCLMRIDGSNTVDLELAPGTYWLSVDGSVANEATAGEGSFTLAVRNVDDYELIECGEIITSTTVGRLSNYGNNGYGAFCNIATQYLAGDRIYRFDVAVAGNYVITLEKLDGTDLRLFVHQRLEFLGQEFFVCLGASEVDGTMEVLSSNMTLGEYYIIVDGTEGNEGGFRLSIACPDDYADIACGELVMGNTATRVNYRSEYDCNTEAVYGGGDRTYRFELANDDDVTINLTPVEGDDLDLILMTDSFTCIAISDTADGTKETMQQMLTAGIYYIIVDGATVNDTSAQGPYMLEVKCASLPVELVSFRGNEIETGILLDWETASEIGFEGFYLQKSQTGESWDNLNWQAGKGSPTTPAKYSYVDGQPYQGTNFFRLKAVDFDGTINYSGIIQVNYKKGVARPEFRAYPTLATDWITVEGYEEGRTIRYEIRTVLGQLLQSGRINGNNQNIEISALPTGMFYLTLNDGSRYKTIPVRKN